MHSREMLHQRKGTQCTDGPAPDTRSKLPAPTAPHLVDFLLQFRQVLWSRVHLEPGGRLVKVGLPLLRRTQQRQGAGASIRASPRPVAGAHGHLQPTSSVWSSSSTSSSRSSSSSGSPWGHARWAGALAASDASAVHAALCPPGPQCHFCRGRGACVGQGTAASPPRTIPGGRQPSRHAHLVIHGAIPGLFAPRTALLRATATDAAQAHWRGHRGQPRL